MKKPIANFVQGRYGLEIRIKTDQTRSTEKPIRTRFVKDIYQLTLQKRRRLKRLTNFEGVLPEWS